MTTQNPDLTCDDATTIQEVIVEYETVATAAATTISFGGYEAAINETDNVDEAQTPAATRINRLD